MIDMKPAKNRTARPAAPDRREDVFLTTWFTAGTLNLYTDVKVKSMEKQVREQGTV
ncbi:hypothetical protein ACWC0A_31785 [Streptomyces scopuliridis]